MMDFRPIFLVVGFLLAALGVIMLVPAIVDGFYGHPDWMVFVVSAGLTSFVGVATALPCRVGRFRMSVRQAFVMTTMSWTAVTAFAALPFALSDLDMGIADAFFEAMSGITTTGSTSITGLDAAPPGILLWRGLLQWLGGLGIVVMAVALLPVLGVGGMQMFRVEGFETGEKMLPRATRIAALLSAVYSGLTLLWMIMLWFAGMDGLEAAVHAMTTIATGGFSTSDGSIGHFDSTAIDFIVIAGMLIGSLPFVLYVRAVQGNASPLFNDSQVRWFFVVVGVAVLAAVAFLHFEEASSREPATPPPTTGRGAGSPARSFSISCSSAVVPARRPAASRSSVSRYCGRPRILSSSICSGRTASLSRTTMAGPSRTMSFSRCSVSFSCSASASRSSPSGWECWASTS